MIRLPVLLAPVHRQMLEILHAHDVDYILVGGVAMLLNGVSHMTDDIDLIIARNPANDQHLDNALMRLDARVQAMSERGTMFTTALGRLEILRTTSGVGDYNGWAPRATTITLQDGLSIRYAHPADIERNKQAAGRIEDHEHIQRLRAAAEHSQRLQSQTPTPTERLLGPRPLDELAARTWQTLAMAIDRYRDAHRIDDADPHPLGPASDDARGAQRRRPLRLAAQLAPHDIDELDPPA